MIKTRAAQRFLTTASIELGTKKELVCGPRKNRDIAKARHIIMYCLWKCGYSHSFIGRLMNKNHATSVLACRKVEGKPDLVKTADYLIKLKLPQDGPDFPPEPKKYIGKWVSLFKVYEAKCQVCGTEDILEIHHKIPIKNGGSNEANNLLILCPNHHVMLHRGLLLIKTVKPPKMLSSYQSNNL